MTRKFTAAEIREAFANHNPPATVKAETVIAFVELMRGMATRAYVALHTGQDQNDSIQELETFLGILDEYPDILPEESHGTPNQHA